LKETTLLEDTNQAISNPSELKMKIQLSVIEDLGIKLYSRLSSVLSELVANAWDAEAKLVEISVPEGAVDQDKTVITVTDYGTGMTKDELRDKYLMVGRKRRIEESSEVSPKLGRRIMGRKGIGKLAGFGVANIVTLRTTKGGLGSEIVMNKEDIVKDAQTKGEYLPKISYLERPTKNKDGTTVILSNIQRPGIINIDTLRRSLATHFSVIGKEFSVKINGIPITKADKIGPDDMEFLWKIDESISKDHPDWKVTGWIGSGNLPLDEDDRGIVIMARGKLLQAATMFGIKVANRYSFAYIAGFLNAEFMDQTEDLIATDRQNLIWDSLQGEALKKWGEQKVSEFADFRASEIKNQREKAIREDSDIKQWLSNLTEPERKVADKIITTITSKETIDSERQKQLMYFVKDYFDYRAFYILLESLEETDDASLVLKVFEEWYVIEAREILRVAKGRLKTLNLFKKMIDQNAPEKPDIHEFLSKSPWIIDPSWTIAFDEKRYTTILKTEFKKKIEAEENRQIDLVCIGTGDTVHIIELKRPDVKITKEELIQIFDYVTFIKEQLGSDPGKSGHKYSSASGYLICGKRPEDASVKELEDTFKPKRIHIYTYQDLIVNAEALMKDYTDKIEEYEKKDTIRRSIFVA
jgi:hypothetical protein